MGGRALSGAFVTIALLGLIAPAPASIASSGRATQPRRPSAIAPSPTGRYFVTFHTPALADRLARGTGALTTQRSAVREALALQAGAIDLVARSGGRLGYRFARLVNGFSAEMTSATAGLVAGLPGVEGVEPVGVARRSTSTSVPFIGARKVWSRYGATGRGVRIAVVDTGVDYTHAAFGGPGTRTAYSRNDPGRIERGSFPTKKVIDGHDFVGDNYNVLDGSTNNDRPRPDPDPLDLQGHGTHVAGTCCGKEVGDRIGRGVAPAAKILAYKVWDEGNSTADVLVAAYERAVDPNQDGNLKDRADVLSFSGGVESGTAGSVEARAAQRVVDVGTVFVAAAGNSGNQLAGGNAYVAGTPGTAPGVIAVGASIDEYRGQRVRVVMPEGADLPSDGYTIHQFWSGIPPDEFVADVIDARAWYPPSSDDGEPAAEDRQLCDATPEGQPFEGAIALVFKGGRSDCGAPEKVFRAQHAGAAGVLLWSGFDGDPFDLAIGDFVERVDIPAWMIRRDDGAALGSLVSPNAPSSYNDAGSRVRIRSRFVRIPAFGDRVIDFTSEGPARITSELKPDLAAPGYNISAAGVGSGRGARTLSGTSMAAPHVSGVAALLLQLHEHWSPERVKAILMNNAQPHLAGPEGEAPIPATVQGAGRVRAAASAAATMVVTPPSISYGFQPVAGAETLGTRTLEVRNLNAAPASLDISGEVRYADVDPSFAELEVSVDGATFGPTGSLTLAPKTTAQVLVRLTLHPEVVPAERQLLSWFDFNPGVDGAVILSADDGGIARVPWHVVPMAASEMDMEEHAVELPADGSAVTLNVVSEEAAGRTFADLYQLGAREGAERGDEGDITHVGARSFTGGELGDGPSGLPDGTDPLSGGTWRGSVSEGRSTIEEPVEFVIRTAAPHSTARTTGIDVSIDAGDDGVFADERRRADFIAHKTRTGRTCLFDLSRLRPFRRCAGRYGLDYPDYNSALTGVVIDALDLGLGSRARIGYRVKLCTAVLSGDVTGRRCDRAGGFQSGRYEMTMRLTAPTLRIDPLVCGGFWEGPGCSEGIRLSRARAGAIEDLLVVFPNNPSGAEVTVVATE